MLKIRDDVDLKALEKFGFFTDITINTYHRPIDDDLVKQFNKSEYLLILNKNRAIIKAKMICVLTFDEETETAWYVKTNKVKKYCEDLIQANLIEKV